LDLRGGSGQEYFAAVRTGTPAVERVVKFRFHGQIMFGYVMIKFGLHKGYPLLYYTRGGSCRLILNHDDHHDDIMIQ
jgi:hypothetical protein